MSAPALAAPTTGRPSSIAAQRDIPAERERVFEFVADLNNHWLLADRFIKMVRLDRGGNGGRVRLRGPLGLYRTATTRVDRLEPGELVLGSATIGPVTSGTVCWTLEDSGAGTLVTLDVRAERLGRLDALLLSIGGRRWLRRLFARILVRLEQRLA
jgi:uncharacterized protein YndB with AHSA1/START domain